MPRRKKRTSERRFEPGRGDRMRAKPLAVVARSHYEGNTFNVAEYPSGVLLAQGFENQEQAQMHADNINRGK